MLTLRTHQPGDLGWIISTHGEIYSREFGFDGSFEINIADKVLKYFSTEDDFNRVWIAMVDDKRAGSVAVRALSEATAFVNFVVVLNEFRGQGIARSLMDGMIEHVRKHRYQKIRLETFTCLEVARELYRDLGFTVIENSVIHAFGRDLTREFWELTLQGSLDNALRA
ncbi:MAG: GNAT family N-acetyltransferase [Proteobacteria bacterium]|nr:GNAT family N-acetyltransferase [Pseudomonadota bacterium]